MATVLEPKINHDPPAESSDRSFGFVFAGVFAIVGLLPLWHSQMPRWWALGMTMIFGLTALVGPQLLHPLNRAWLALGRLLHKIVSPVVLGAIFFIFVTPTGFIMRWRGNDLLSLKWRPDLKSYWVDRDPPTNSQSSMKNQY